MDWSGAHRRFRNLILRHRRALAAGLIGIAIVNGVAAVAPGRGNSRPVIVAATDIAAGQALSPTNLRIAQWPAAVVPSDWPTSASSLVGRTAAGPIAAGEPVTATRVLGRTKWAGGPGTVLVPVRIADSAAVSLVSPGDVVDILAAWPTSQAGPTTATTVASRARIVTIPRPATNSLSSAVDGALIVLAVSSATAVRLAAAAVSARLSVTLLPQ